MNECLSVDFSPFVETTMHSAQTMRISTEDWSQEAAQAVEWRVGGFEGNSSAMRTKTAAMLFYSVSSSYSYPRH